MEVMDLITGMAYDFNQTLIIVTHDTEISGYAHRVVYLRDGNIEKITENENIIKGEAN
jgi:putative ABC transport system ATP-binding protein